MRTVRKDKIYVDNMKQQQKLTVKILYYYGDETDNYS
jgi:hypothetical protein